MKLRALRIAFMLFVLTLACRRSETAAAAPASPSAPHQARPSMPSNVSAQRRTPIVIAVHNVTPTVVNIQTEATIRRPDLDPFFGSFGFDRTYKTQSLGSGFVWASDGIIVTNNHVIQGASRITVNFSDSTQLPAKVIGVDHDSDLAVLRVDAKNLIAAPLGTSADLLIGEPVIAVGNPFGLSGSVTTGVVSATGRSVPSKEEGRTFTDFIQTDASINPGNSGGPLLNIEGKVIGINVSIYAQAQGIGFAIPVDRAKKIVEDLRRYGQVHSAWIGAVTATVTPEEARRLGVTTSRGAFVTKVYSESPAASAGLRPGDVIVEAGGRPVDSREAFTTYTSTVVEGKAIPIRIRRGDASLPLNLTPTAPPRHLGLRILADVTGLDVENSGRGVVVATVRRGSRSDATGLAPGDQIVGINGVEVSTTDELEAEVERSSERSALVVNVARGRYVYTLTFPMGM